VATLALSWVFVLLLDRPLQRIKRKPVLSAHSV